MIKDHELLKKYNYIWIKINNSIKKSHLKQKIFEIQNKILR